MPIFAAMLLELCNAFAYFFARFMGVNAAIKLAAYSAWLFIVTSLLATVYVCITSIYTMVQNLLAGAGGGGDSWVGAFVMGLGVFIPSNAGAVLACVASVWIATNIYRVQSFAIGKFHGGGQLTTT